MYIAIVMITMKRKGDSNMEGKEIVECKCGADCHWIIADTWICCSLCGQDYELDKKIDVNTLNCDIALR